MFNRRSFTFVLILAGCSRPDDTAQIEKQLDLYAGYARTNNYFGMASLFAEDGVLESNIRGPKAIQQHLAANTGLKVVEYSIDPEKPTVKGDTAEQSVVYQQQLRTPQGSTTQLTGRLKITWVRASSDRWLISSLTTS